MLRLMTPLRSLFPLFSLFAIIKESVARPPMLISFLFPFFRPCSMCDDTSLSCRPSLFHPYPSLSTIIESPSFLRFLKELDFRSSELSFHTIRFHILKVPLSAAAASGFIHHELLPAFSTYKSFCMNCDGYTLCIAPSQERLLSYPSSLSPLPSWYLFFSVLDSLPWEIRIGFSMDLSSISFGFPPPPSLE